MELRTASLRALCCFVQLLSQSSARGGTRQFDVLLLSGLRSDRRHCGAPQPSTGPGRPVDGDQQPPAAPSS